MEENYRYVSFLIEDVHKSIIEQSEHDPGIGI